MLEPLSPAARAALDRHNREALSQLVAYVERFVAGLGTDGGAAARADEALPLSGVRVPLMARSAQGADPGEQAGGGFVGCCRAWGHARHGPVTALHQSWGQS